MRNVLLWAFVVAVLLPVTSVNGEQYAQGNQVVHTRRLPVVAHRIVPPFRGVHVYAGRRR